MNDKEVRPEFNSKTEIQDTSITDLVKAEQESEYDTKDLTYEMHDENGLGDTVRAQHDNQKYEDEWIRHKQPEPELEKPMQVQFEEATLSEDINTHQEAQENEDMTPEQFQIMQEFEDVAENNIELDTEQDQGY